MTYERLIHDYLDVGLDDNMQASLFNELAINPNLRSEFNKQMKIHLIAKENFDNIAPPADLTNRVFMNAGFSAPFASVPGFKFNYLFGLLPVLLLLFAVSNFVDIDNLISPKTEQITEVALNNKSGKNLNSNKQFGNTIPISNANAVEDNISNNESDLGFSKNGAENIFQRKSNNNFNSATNRNEQSKENIARNNSSFNNTLTNDENITYLHEKDMDYAGKPHFIISSSPIKSDLVSIRNLNSKENFGNIQTVRTLIITPNNNNNSLFNLGPDNTQMAVNFRGINNSSLYKSIPDANLPIANYAIGFTYKFHNNWSIIGEYSKENFFQEFQNINKQGLNYITRQNPDLDLFSVGIRYTAKDLFKTNVIYPFAQSNIGYSPIGPVAKLIFGAEYRLSESISFVPTYELSSLIYANQFGTYYATNNGFSLGISYNFYER